MNTITLDQTVSVTDLQRDYNEVITRAEKSKDSIVVVRHSKPVVRLVSEKIYRQMMKFKRMYEIEQTLRIVEESRKEYASGKMLSTDDMSMEELIGYEGK